ncbi:hypothetical protein BCR44DRAFT_1427845 [Catenaria anguillulae PL171]|uniref:VPS10 domain-containing protein n=1 Tax=Catenaria anguillulae PL171 TaxID=765915 RepID=A0A1Y2HW46_9FUNG|nr:hypothetical protein BCR44DRAFT_1427845 [Catenaria anguillulae PL171]
MLLARPATRPAATTQTAKSRSPFPTPVSMTAMPSRRSLSSSSLLATLITLSLLLSQAYAQSQLQFTTSYLRESPRQLSFFPGSSSALLLPAISAPSRSLLLSTDSGKQWTDLNQLTQLIPASDRLLQVILHPFEPQTAFVIASGTHHVVTRDRGATWAAFDTPAPPSPTMRMPLAFHATQIGHVIFMGQRCSPGCVDESFVTTDGFKSPPKRMLQRVKECKFAKSTKEMQLADDRLVLCVAWKDMNRGPRTPFDYRVVSSTDYFANDKQVLDFGGAVAPSAGVVGLSVVEKFVTAAILPADRGADLDLYTSLDGRSWSLARFPSTSGSSSPLRENAYTILESQPYSLTVDVLTGTTITGTLFTSNSNGTYFQTSLPYTRRSLSGATDFERIEWLAGVMLANQFVPERGQAVSRVSWDEGGHWHALKRPDRDVHGREWPACSGDECALHLHSVTAGLGVVGKMFSERSAPGLLTGVGNVGTHLTDVRQASMFVSTDGGVTWNHVQEGVHHYRLLDSGSLLVLVDMDSVTNELLYSKDVGKSWNKVVLPHTFAVRALMTDAQSLSSSLLVFGVVRDTTDKRGQFAVAHVDFASVFSRKCGDADFETWKIKVEGECVMGRTTSLRRVKPGADCLVGATSVPEPKFDTCPCEADDFECDLNFEPDGKGGCVLAKGAVDPLLPKNCVGTYDGSSGWRKIPGNMCKGGLTKDATVKRECAASGAVSVNTHTFPSGAAVAQTIVLPPSTLVVKTALGTMYHTRDGGRTWKDSLRDVGLLVQHEHVPERLFAALVNGEVFYSDNGGEGWSKVPVPNPPNAIGARMFDFHPEHPDWIVYVGAKDCPSPDECHTVASVSKDNGKTWTELDTYVSKCLWSRDVEFKKVADDQAESRTRLLKNVIDYFVDHGFLLAAEVDGDKLSVKVTSDGTIFHAIEFPPDMSLNKRAFTVLSSSAARVFLDIVQTGIDGREMGALFTSDGTGQEFSLSFADTNRGGLGGSIVDFTRPFGTRAVAIANRVTNADAIRSGRSASKKIQSWITYNDGGLWQRLPSRECDDACFVQLFNAGSMAAFPPLVSAAAAGGIIVGIGKSGNDETYLGPPESADTFLTIDGGRHWAKVADGPHRAAILDRGGIIVLARAFTGAVSSIKWSWDFGATWQDQSLGAGVKFYEIAGLVADADGKQAVVHVFGIDDAGYGTWTLAGPRGQMCSLGERLRHPRRKRDVRCIVGALDVTITKEFCECDMDDYECDKGFWRNAAGQCYLSRSGYRKIAASVCKGGQDVPSKVIRVCGRENEPAPSILYNKQVELVSPIIAHVFTAHKSVVMLDQAGRVQYSPDEGRTWVLLKTTSADCFCIPLAKLYAFIWSVYLAKDNELLRSSDGGKTYTKSRFPGKVVQGVVPLSVHSEEPDWLLFTGHACPLARDGGANWHLLMANVKSCSWARTRQFTLVSRHGTVCIIENDVVYSDDYFINDKSTVLKGIADLTVEGEYLVGITQDAGDKMGLMVSRDLEVFGRAQFPANLDAAHQGVTTLPGHSGALLVNVALSRTKDREYGRLFKSNFNGTLFSLVHDNTNQNSNGFVDYEMIQGIPGIAVLNVVANVADVATRNEPKKLQTVMTYDDGSTWSFLTPPERDARGEPIACKDRNDRNTCALHLHSYTERRDPQNVFDSGNVYLTRDAGRTWREVQRGAFQYEFVFPHQRIVAQPGQSGVPEAASSETFLLFGTRVADQKQVMHVLDFSSMRQRPCKLDLANAEQSDYEPWTLDSSKAGLCILTQQEVVKTDVQRCACAREDFECDFGFQKNGSGDCHPLSECVGGLELDKLNEHICGSGMSAGGWIALFLVPISCAGLGYWGWTFKRRGGDFANLVPREIPSVQRVLDWYSRLRPGMYHGESSTSLLDED